MALAALGTVAVLDVGTATAEAAPSVSRFAGTYSANVWGPVPVTIEDGGRITGYLGTGRSDYVSVSGRVSADGGYSFTVSGAYEDDSGNQGHFRYPVIKFSYKSAGTMTLDPDGNIVGTDDAGGSFVWLRQ